MIFDRFSFGMLSCRCLNVLLNNGYQSFVIVTIRIFPIQGLPLKFFVIFDMQVYLTFVVKPNFFSSFVVSFIALMLRKSLFNLRFSKYSPVFSFSE